ncbi:MAG: hypothetical protein J6R22_00665 [Alphaproteobacteria bacterium]|nr:hypothetical protein [Alphaproteobacteria bacterium]
MATTNVIISTINHDKVRVCKLPNTSEELRNCPLRRFQGLNGITYRETTQEGSGLRKVHIGADMSSDNAWLTVDCLYSVAKYICKHCEYNKEKQR